MLRKQVKKYGLALGLGISMLLLAGCEKKSVDDLYNMTESTSKEEMQTSKNGMSFRSIVRISVIHMLS